MTAWRSHKRTPASVGKGNLPEDAALVARQNGCLARPTGYFTKTPVHLVRGEGVWLYDEGNAYLDTYNNVASVALPPSRGAAMANQPPPSPAIPAICTTPSPGYSERLRRRCPPHRPHDVHLHGVRSERSCPADRAGTHRRHRGDRHRKRLHHGVTSRCRLPSLGPGVALGEHVRTVPAPDPARGCGGGRATAAGVQAAIDDLRRHGVRPAILIVDTVLSSDGVIPDPAGFLAPAVAAIRAAGGLFVADEVQPGFGRTGAGMWGFARHGIVPDMVSMGKPMGNGYPVAGLALRPEVVADFGTSGRYFNTFGGNAVAAATAGAVLDVIEDEGLIDNARTTGAYLAEGLRDLADRYRQIGDVRAAGLFIGADIVTDGRADARLTHRIVNDLRARRVLISATGRHANTLKIRPPLVFARDHAGVFLDRLEDVLKGLG